MTLEEFNDALDEAFEAKGTMPVYLGNGRVRVGSEIINLEGNQEAVLEALLKRGGAATLTELRSDTLVDDVPRVLKGIRKRTGLERYIILPGGRGKGGYRTTIIDGREARHNAPQNV
jgi:tRNA A37 threonylcarbamoyladenosine synthetase subunit TsaC/SUA5/YrdC